MLVFAAIALAAFVVVAGSFLFGHDHDLSHDHGGLDHDASGEATISFFSPKIIGTLLMGFGAAGAIGQYYNLNHLQASLVGLLAGAILSAAMYSILALFYRQQSSSLVPTDSAIGGIGTVTVSIAEGGAGEVGMSLGGEYVTRMARSSDGAAIARGQTVRVVSTMGSELIVEKQ